MAYPIFFSKRGSSDYINAKMIIQAYFISSYLAQSREFAGTIEPSSCESSFVPNKTEYVFDETPIYMCVCVCVLMCFIERAGLDNKTHQRKLRLCCCLIKQKICFLYPQLARLNDWYFFTIHAWQYFQEGFKTIW